MYEDYFNFSGQPFKLNPDPKFFFGSRSHNKAMAYLHYGLRQAEGFIVITGEIGAGKSMLISHLLDQLDRSRIAAAHLLTPNLKPDDLLSHILSAFRIEPAGDGKSADLDAFEDFLFDQLNHGRRVLLIVDEVQNLPPETLEELRVLSNMDYEGTPLFQVFLVGQTDFRPILAGDDMEQLRQRIIASYHLEPLGVAETAEYIRHRLSVVGWNGDPSFTDDSFQAIHEATGGVPRKINKLANRLLLSCALEESHRADRETIITVVSDLAAENMASEFVAPNAVAPSGGLEAERVEGPAEEGDEMTDQSFEADEATMDAQPAAGDLAYVNGVAAGAPDASHDDAPDDAETETDADALQERLDAMTVLDAAGETPPPGDKDEPVEKDASDEREEPASAERVERPAAAATAAATAAVGGASVSVLDRLRNKKAGVATPEPAAPEPSVDEQPEPTSALAGPVVESPITEDREGGPASLEADPVDAPVSIEAFSAEESEADAAPDDDVVVDELTADEAAIDDPLAEPLAGSLAEDAAAPAGDDRHEASLDEIAEAVTAAATAPAPAPASEDDDAAADEAASETEDFDDASDFAAGAVASAFVAPAAVAEADSASAWNDAVLKSINDTRAELKRAHTEMTFLRQKARAASETREKRKEDIQSSLRRAEMLLADIRANWR
ncbi:MAG: XrtA/PEP-CTERM system-associated ATPase [Pseudomonadota bacterium]